MTLAGWADKQAIERYATVDPDPLTRDVSSAVTGEERDELGNFLWADEPTSRHRGPDALLVILWQRH